MPQSFEDEILKLNQSLLDAIAAGDWETYSQLCAADLTAFEAESRGQLVEGLEFHKYYFDLPAGQTPVRTTMIESSYRPPTVNLDNNRFTATSLNSATTVPIQALSVTRTISLTANSESDLHPPCHRRHRSLSYPSFRFLS